MIKNKILKGFLKLIRIFKCDYCGKRIKENQLYYTITEQRLSRPSKYDYMSWRVSSKFACRKCYKKLYGIGGIKCIQRKKKISH